MQFVDEGETFFSLTLSLLFLKIIYLLVEGHVAPIYLIRAAAWGRTIAIRTTNASEICRRKVNVALTIRIVECFPTRLVLEWKRFSFIWQRRNEASYYYWKKDGIKKISTHANVCEWVREKMEWGLTRERERESKGWLDAAFSYKLITHTVNSPDAWVIKHSWRYIYTHTYNVFFSSVFLHLFFSHDCSSLIFTLSLRYTQHPCINKPFLPPLDPLFLLYGSSALNHAFQFIISFCRKSSQLPCKDTGNCCVIALLNLINFVLLEFFPSYFCSICMPFFVFFNYLLIFFLFFFISIFLGFRTP